LRATAFPTRRLTAKPRRGPATGVGPDAATTATKCGPARRTPVRFTRRKSRASRRRAARRSPAATCLLLADGGSEALPPLRPAASSGTETLSVSRSEFGADGSHSVGSLISARPHHKRRCS
jgi:hypothetical protein